METRLSLDDIKKYEISLSFNRFNAHVYCAAIENKITALCHILDHCREEIEYKFLYKQLGIYFTFFKRDKEKAAKYLEIYHSFCKFGLEKAESLCLLGCAYAIDPTYYSQTLFSDVLALLPKESNDTPILLIKAFALQYLALMLHRQARRLQSKDLDTGLIHIKTAIDLQESILPSQPFVKLGLAESLHIYAVILNRFGLIHQDTDKKSHYFNESDKLFCRAAALLNEFCQETQASHYLVAITRQSHGKVLLHLNQHDKAIQLFTAARDEQCKQSTSLIDIAKSLHYIGDGYYQKNEYHLAVEFYLHALICKMKCEYVDDEIVRATQNSLLMALSQIRDKQLAFDLRQKIYETLTKKKVSFVNTGEDLLMVINNDMDEFQKEKERFDVSVSQINHQGFFKPGTANNDQCPAQLNTMNIKLSS